MTVNYDRLNQIVGTAAAMSGVVFLLGEISTALYMVWSQWSGEWDQSGVHSRGTDNGVHLPSWAKTYANSPTLCHNIIRRYLENEDIPQNIIWIHCIDGIILTRQFEKKLANCWRIS